jgi:heme oxygenase
MTPIFDQPDPDTALRHLQAALRDATRAAHHGIDHHALMAPLLKPSLTLAHYSYVLQVMNWVHRPLHRCLQGSLQRFCPDHVDQISDRPHWLAADLKSLGCDALQPPPSALAQWHGPRLTSAAELAGVLYVIEGSTLGGQVITRQLQTSLQVSPSQGARFFHGHGDQTMARWQAYWRFATELCPAAAVPEACAAAVRMFGDFEQLFDAALCHQTVNAKITP